MARLRLSLRNSRRQPLPDQVDEEVHRAVRQGPDDDTIVHFDPCRPRHCPGCPVDKCPVRSAQLLSRESFTLERATRGDELLDTGFPLSPTEPV